MSQEFLIRRACESDVRAVFDISNDPVVRSNSIHSETIPWEDHKSWYARILGNKDVMFFIAEAPDGGVVGQVRLAQESEGWLISISIAREYRGKGLAAAILNEVMKSSAKHNFIAEIADTNKASMALFLRCGFVMTKQDVLVKDGRIFHRFAKRS